MKRLGRLAQAEPSADAVAPAQAPLVVFEDGALPPWRQDKAEIGDVDRGVWPSGKAMNDAENDRFARRVQIFGERDLGLDDAEALADRLLARDRDGDDRRVCMECSRFRAGRCPSWRLAGVAGPGIPSDWIQQLQRCHGFAEVVR